MADHDRWSDDRGRYGDDPSGAPGFEQYGRRGGYGAGDRDRGSYGGYGAARYGEAYGDHGRSFDRGEGSGYRAGGGSAHGYRGERYGQDSYGLSGHGDGAHDERYGGTWGRHPYEHGEGGAYSGWDQGGQAYGGSPGYNERPRYGRSQDYADLHGYGGRGWRGQEASQRDHERGQDRTWMERTGERIASWFAGGEREGGRHRGRGPKGYTRADERICEDINDRLTDDAWIDASEIEVQVANGEVTLTGVVGDRTDKRRAEDIAEQVPGVKHVQNNLRVQPAQNAGATSVSGASDGGLGAGGTSGTA